MVFFSDIRQVGVGASSHENKTTDEDRSNSSKEVEIGEKIESTAMSSRIPVKGISGSALAEEKPDISKDAKNMPESKEIQPKSTAQSAITKEKDDPSIKSDNLQEKYSVKNMRDASTKSKDAVQATEKAMAKTTDNVSRHRNVETPDVELRTRKVPVSGLAPETFKRMSESTESSDSEPEAERALRKLSEKREAKQEQLRKLSQVQAANAKSTDPKTSVYPCKHSPVVAKVVEQPVKPSPAVKSKVLKDTPKIDKISISSSRESMPKTDDRATKKVSNPLCTLIFQFNTIPYLDQ